MVEVIAGCVAPMLVPASDRSRIVCLGVLVVKTGMVAADTDIGSKGGKFRWRQCGDH